VLSLLGDLGTATDISLAEISVTAKNASRSEQPSKRLGLNNMASTESVQNDFSEISTAIV